MENTNRYVIGMILAAAIVVFGGFFFLQGTIKKARQNVDFDLSYSMPRPKSALYNFFFGLEGREIEHTEINPFKDKKASAEAGGVRKDLPKIAAQKTDDKKTTSPAAQAAVAAKKAEVKVNVVNAEAQNPLTAAGAGLDEAVQTGGANAHTGLAANNVGEGKKSTETLSAAQWRALVLGQPTKENVMKLIAAFNNKEVESGTLYMIMNDLMQSSNAETQGLGLTIGQSVPSLKSFSIVSDNYDKLDAATKKAADTYLMTYMQSSKLPILALALQSTDTQIVARAAQVMVTGLEQIKAGHNSNTSRADNGRGIVGSSTAKAYSQFIAIFQDLVKSSDSTVAGLAQNALTQIQSLSNT